MDYYTNFIFEIENVTAKERKFLTKYQEHLAKNGIAIIEQESRIFLQDDCGQVDTGELADILQKFIQKFRPGEIFCIRIAFTASRPVIGAYGGAAILITKNEIVYFDTDNWLEEQMELRRAK